MKDAAKVLDPVELIGCELRGLYSAHGYTRYRMSKFEEYDLYSRHKEFLVSDGVLTFTDTDGRLRALKPDVTLSIIKNTRDREDPLAVDKLFYCENVYRISRQSGGFREIQQIGLECIGGVDSLCVCDTVFLAARSLEAIGRPYVLELSHTRLLEAVADRIASGAEADDREELRLKIIGAVKTKNRSLAGEIAAGSLLGDAGKGLLFELTSSGTDLCRLAEFFEEDVEASGYIRELSAVTGYLKARGMGGSAAVDLSVDGGADYYNGTVFRGYVEGISDRVLSGGRYDLLMERMGRKGSAVGFAVYLDEIARLFDAGSKTDADTVILYRDGDDVLQVLELSERLSRDGSVYVCRSVPDGFRYRKLVRFPGKTEQTE